MGESLEEKRRGVVFDVAEKILVVDLLMQLGETVVDAGGRAEPPRFVERGEGGFGEFQQGEDAHLAFSGDGQPFVVGEGSEQSDGLFENEDGAGKLALRRVDPELSLLAPMTDYPLLGPNGAVESFTGLPRTTPFNLMALVMRTPTLGLRDLMRVDVPRAVEMLAFDPVDTYARWDDTSARPSCFTVLPGRARPRSISARSKPCSRPARAP